MKEEILWLHAPEEQGHGRHAPGCCTGIRGTGRWTCSRRCWMAPHIPNVCTQRWYRRLQAGHRPRRQGMLGHPKFRYSNSVAIFFLHSNDSRGYYPFSKCRRYFSFSPLSSNRLHIHKEISLSLARFNCYCGMHYTTFRPRLQTFHQWSATVPNMTESSTLEIKDEPLTENLYRFFVKLGATRRRMLTLSPSAKALSPGGWVFSQPFCVTSLPRASLATTPAPALPELHVIHPTVTLLSEIGVFP